MTTHDGFRHVACDGEAALLRPNTNTSSPEEKAPELSQERLAELRRVAEMEERAKAAETALVNLTCNGSEFYLRDGDGFRVDVPACLAYLAKVRDSRHAVIKGAIAAKQAAEAKLAQAVEALKPFGDACELQDEGLSIAVCGDDGIVIVDDDDFRRARSITQEGQKP